MGKEYKWVRIGKLDWMTENLRCDNPFYDDVYNPKWTNDYGDGLSLTGTLEDWQKWYAEFGNYYTWEEAVANAPDGWRLPTDDDFKTLERELGIKQGDLDKEYLVVTYDGGAIGVRSCNCDSFTAIFEELTKMLDGGYYDEVQDLHYYENNEMWKEASLEELEEDFKERD